MTELIVTFLGTAGSTPTKERNVCSACISFQGNNFLLDCSEGIQKKLIQAKISYLKIAAIFISHLHADHFLGLPGLIATMTIHKRDHPLTIFGPEGTKKLVKTILSLVTKPSFEIKIIEITKPGVILEEEDFMMKAIGLYHSVPCYGFIFLEKTLPGKFNKKKALALGIPEGPLFSELQKGNTIKLNNKIIKPKQVLEFDKKRKERKIAYVVDTRPKAIYIQKIQGIDLLIHEATFIEKHLSRAKEIKHSTAREAGLVAQKAEVKQLALIHFSNRYNDLSLLENEARLEFANIILSNDLMKLRIS